MTGHTALLASIVESPQEDTPRLVYADYLEGIGEQDRADFVRVQCELAKIETDVEKTRLWTRPRTHHRERNLLYRREKELLPIMMDAVPDGWYVDDDRPRIGTGVKWHRGFISTIRTDWQTFLAVEASLIQGSVPCPDYGEVLLRHPQDCRCSGTGLVKRPFVETMQPVLDLILTTRPDISKAEFESRWPGLSCKMSSGEPCWFEMPEQHGTDYDIVDGRIIYAQRGTGAYRYYGEAVAALRGNL